MKINIGSKNPAKVTAVEMAFNLFFDNVSFQSFDVDSKVDAQPKSLKEIMIGARNRARDCFNDCNYSVGLESGIFLSGEGLTNYFNTCACVIYDGKKFVGFGLSPCCEYPRNVINKILEKNSNINEIASKVFDCENIGQKQGAIGELTKGKYTRADYTVAGIIMALFPILNKELYDKE